MTKIKNGAHIKKQIEIGELQDLEEIEDKLEEEYANYHENVGKKWIIAIIGLILGLIIGYFAMPTVYGLTRSNYNRAGIE